MIFNALGLSGKKMIDIGGINAVVSPISVPINDVSLLDIHIKRGAFLVHVVNDMPLVFDKDSTFEFLKPLFYMMELGCNNNVLIPNTNDRMAVLDGLLLWQMFGGIALPLIDDISTSLKVIDDVVSTKVKGNSGDVDLVSLCDLFTQEKIKRGIYEKQKQAL